MHALRSERGQTMAEYSVVLGVLTLGILLTLGGLAGSVGALYERAAGAIASAF